MNSMTRIHRTLFYILLILLPTQIGLHFWPSWSFVLGRRVDYLSPTLFLTDIIVVALLICWFFDSLSVFRNKKKIHTIINRSPLVFLTLGVFICFIIDNIMHAVNVPVAIYAWIKFFEYAVLGLYIVKTKPAVNIVSLCLGAAMFYSSVIAISQFFLRHSVGGVLWWIGERTFSLETPGIAKIALCNLTRLSCPIFLRPYATLPHPNVLGGFLGVVLLLVGTTDFEAFKKIIPRRVHIDHLIFLFLQWILLIVGAASLILTFSRSAWAMVLLASAAVLILRHLNKQKVRVLLIGILIFFAVVIFYIFSAHFSDESLVVREQLNNAALSIIQAHPLVGVGLGNFLVALPTFIPSRQIYFLQPVHNIYLLFISEVGFFGVMLFTLICYVLMTNLRKFCKAGETANERFAIRISLLGLLFVGLIDHYSVTVQQGQLLLTLLISMSV